MRASPVDLVDRVADPQPQIGRNLIVAAAGRCAVCGRRPPAGRSAPARCACGCLRARCGTRIGLAQFPGGCRSSALHNLLALVGRDQADLGQHLGMGDRGRDVVRIQPAVEAHAFGELLDAAVRRLAENTSTVYGPRQNSQVDCIAGIRNRHINSKQGNGEGSGGGRPAPAACAVLHMICATVAPGSGGLGGRLETRKPAML